MSADFVGKLYLIHFFNFVFKTLVKNLPSNIMNNSQDYLLSAIYHRLDLSDNALRKEINHISIQLCSRLPTQCIFDHLLLKCDCKNSNIRRNTVDILTLIILTTEITQFGLRSILEKLVHLIFVPDAKVKNMCYLVLFKYSGS